MMKRLLNALCLDKWSLVEYANNIVERFGLQVVNAEYYDELQRIRYEHLFMAYRIEQLEEELEEWREPDSTTDDEEARRQFLESVIGDEEYADYLEWLHTPKASEY